MNIKPFTLKSSISFFNLRIIDNEVTSKVISAVLNPDGRIVGSILMQAIELFAVLCTSILLSMIIQSGDYFFNLWFTSIWR